MSEIPVKLMQQHLLQLPPPLNAVLLGRDDISEKLIRFDVSKISKRYFGILDTSMYTVESAKTLQSTQPSSQLHYGIKSQHSYTIEDKTIAYNSTLLLVSPPSLNFALTAYLISV